MDKLKNMNTEYKIVNIINDFKHHFENKNDVFSLLLRLKQSLEFNALINWKELYKELSLLYRNDNPYYNNPEYYTPDPINVNDMGENDIFVFGSNTQGEHTGGAAVHAVLDYGAIIGQPRGLQGRSYGIVTKDYTKNEEVNLLTIEKEIDNLIVFAIENPSLTFWVTKIGTGISGYELSDIAGLFKYKIIPNNIILPKEFASPQMYETYFYSKNKNIYYKIVNNNTIIRANMNKDELGINETIRENIRMILTDVELSTEDEFLDACEKIIRKIFV